ncbi:hypothetical protein KP509_09G064900 [Ceratopteris richardii]|uniref:Dynein light chain n=1 Tax=Ceratopteris richardii TaxID=49495 RepID=A0A8T2U836_CERRI|nr:hypothetical protein KP509_09G064900 [Ceratopteris richardii]KAH7429756.1 hypothetical protein KP509_09G064900 [Ceratopteris richardii]
MESSGQRRAVTLMNAARRNHFVSRIEKYEAKVRQARAQMRERKEVSPTIEQKCSVPNAEAEHVDATKELKDVVADQHRTSLKEESQTYTLEKRATESAENALLRMQAPIEEDQRPCSYHEAPCKPLDADLCLKKVRENDYSSTNQTSLQHEGVFLPHDEAHYQHEGHCSPDQKMQMQQKEVIVSGIPQRTSSNIESVVKGLGALEMSGNTVGGKVLPIDFVSSDAHASIYFDYKPPPVAEVNIAAIAETLNIRIKAADMSVSMQEHAFRCARESLDTVGKTHSKRIAYTLKKEFDRVYGPAWHCIVGTSFGSYVTHSLGGFVYFSLDKVSILLFKTTVEPIEIP